MDNALYVTLSRQKLLLDQMDVVANNVANANTTGYKADRSLFHQYLMNTGDPDTLEFANNLATYQNQNEGPLQETRRVFDVAIQGEGYFRLESPLGTRLTRAGNFRLNANNELVSQQGYIVGGQGGAPVVFQQGDTNILVDNKGVVTANGEQRGQIGVFTPEDSRQLRKIGEGMYSLENTNFQPAEEGKYVIVQGMLEGSNVSSVQEITSMINVSRSVGTASNLVSSLQDLQSEAVRRIASNQQ
jgi:flagellar basal-body rod protein FlgF